LDIDWLLSPRKGQRLSNVGSLVPLHEGGEVEQCSARFLQLESQAAPEVQIVVDGLPKCVHCAKENKPARDALHHSGVDVMSAVSVTGL
jgi:hypothetical protein